MTAPCEKPPSTVRLTSTPCAPSVSSSQAERRSSVGRKVLDSGAALRSMTYRWRPSGGSSRGPKGRSPRCRSSGSRSPRTGRTSCSSPARLCRRTIAVLRSRLAVAAGRSLCLITRLAKCVERSRHARGSRVDFRSGVEPHLPVGTRIRPRSERGAARARALPAQARRGCNRGAACARRATHSTDRRALRRLRGRTT